jgi:hypothetical protein
MMPEDAEELQRAGAAGQTLNASTAGQMENSGTAAWQLNPDSGGLTPAQYGTVQAGSVNREQARQSKDLNDAGMPLATAQRALKSSKVGDEVAKRNAKTGEDRTLLGLAETAGWGAPPGMSESVWAKIQKDFNMTTVPQGPSDKQKAFDALMKNRAAAAAATGEGAAADAAALNEGRTGAMGADVNAAIQKFMPGYNPQALGTSAETGISAMESQWDKNYLDWEAKAQQAGIRQPNPGIETPMPTRQTVSPTSRPFQFMPNPWDRAQTRASDLPTQTVPTDLKESGKIRAQLEQQRMNLEALNNAIAQLRMRYPAGGQR